MTPRPRWRLWLIRALLILAGLYIAAIAAAMLMAGQP